MGGQNTGIQVGSRRGGSPPPPGSCEIVITTWAALVEKLDAGTATACHYLISDFRTVHNTLGTPSNSGSVPTVHLGTIEPLYVTPSSDSTLQLQAWSALYPDDLIEYEIIDTSSQNPNDGSSRGRITRRSNVDQNLSTPYDFRNVVFYRPLSVYDFSGVTYPLTIDSIVVNGTTVPLGGGTVNNIAEAVAYLKGSLSGSPIIFNANPLIDIWSDDGAEYGDIAYTDGGGSAVISPTFSPNLYYTFGNNINFDPSGLIATPAVDGNQIANNYNIYLGVVTDHFSGQVQNNIIFGFPVTGFIADVECLNSIVANNCLSIHMDRLCFDINFEDGCSYIYIDQDCGNMYFAAVSTIMMFGQRCNAISVTGFGSTGIIVGQNTASVLIAGDSVTQISIGQYCNNISISGQGSGFIDIAQSCTSIIIIGESNSVISIDKNCIDIALLGNSSNGLIFGQGCTGVNVQGNGQSFWNIGQGCLNMLCVGQRIRWINIGQNCHDTSIFGDDNYKLRTHDLCDGVTFVGNTISDLLMNTGDGVTTSFPFNVGIEKVVPGSFSASDLTEGFSDNGDGTLTGDMGGTGTINYLTHIGTLNFAAPPANQQAITAEFKIDSTAIDTLVTNEVVGSGNGVTTTFVINIANLPISAGSLIVSDGVENFTDNGDGTLTGDQGGTAVVNYVTGIATVNFNAAPANVPNNISSTYSYIIYTSTYSCTTIEVFTGCASLIFVGNADVSIEMPLSAVLFPPLQSQKRCAQGYSNWEVTLDITGLTTIDLTTYPVERFVHLKTTNNLELIDTILGIGTKFPVKFDQIVPAGSYIASDIKFLDTSAGGIVIKIGFLDQSMINVAGVVNIPTAGVYTLSGATNNSFYDYIIFETAYDGFAKSINSRNYLLQQ